jgi:hypothetical protein
MLFTALGNKRRNEMPSSFLMIFPQVSGFLGRIVIVFGAAIILTLPLTNQNANNPTLLSWYFPILIVVSFIVTWIANRTFGWLIGVLASMMVRNSIRHSVKDYASLRTYLRQQIRLRRTSFTPITLTETGVLCRKSEIEGS